MHVLMQYENRIPCVSNAQKLVCGYILVQAERKLNLWIPAEIVVFIMNYFNVSLTAKDFKIERVILGEYETKHLRVSRVINSKERLFTMMLINKDKHSTAKIRRWTRKFMRQYEFLCKLEHHPFINSIHNAWQTKTYLIIIRDYYHGGDLWAHQRKERRFKESVVKIWIAQLILAIDYLHSKDIIDIDLLGEHISLDQEGNVSINTLDTRHDGISHCDSIGYTQVDYLSPEVIQNLGMTKATDWWTLGILMYELLVGIPPFYSQNTNEKYRKIQEVDPLFPPNISDQSKNLMIKLLNKDHNERIGYDEIIIDEFFDGIDWDQVYRKNVNIDYEVKYQHKNLHLHWQESGITHEPPFEGRKWYDTLMKEKTIPRDDDYPQFKTIPPLFGKSDISGDAQK